MVEMELVKRQKALHEVEVEFINATTKFGKFKSAHEGYAVILEELDELKAEVFKKFDVRNMAKLRKEAKQVAAMGLRFMIDITERY